MIPLSDIKNYLSIPSGNTHFDAFLTEQEAIISSAVENYCGRIFSQGTYTQNFYREIIRATKKEIYLYHYPVVSVASVKEGSLTLDASEYILHKPTGSLLKKDGSFFECDDLEVEYTAGYASIPPLIKAVVLALINQGYNKKKSGVDIDFGSDVQSISIPSVISVQFDYTLTSNDRNNAYGAILGKYLNVLDAFRSERVLIGSGVKSYVS